MDKKIIKITTDEKGFSHLECNGMTNLEILGTLRYWEKRIFITMLEPTEKKPDAEKK